MLVVLYTIGYIALLLLAGLLSEDKNVSSNVLFILIGLIPLFGRVFSWW